jgi:thiamine pyrophosphokinase
VGVTLWMFESSWPQNLLDFMEVALIANGEIQSYPAIKTLLAPYHKFVAVDGGLLHCHEMHIKPDLIIGDLDSVPNDLLKFYPDVPTIQFPCEKDESDLELAIDEMIKQSYTKMALFGAVGKRTDHLLYTLYLLTRYPGILTIYSESEVIFRLNKSNHIKAAPGQTVSLIPLNTVHDVTTKGLKWELSHTTLDKHLISLSNVCLGESFSVDVGSGDLLCSINTSPYLT